MSKYQEFKVGDKVRLKRPDSPTMLVVAVAPSLKAQFVKCTWDVKTCIYLNSELLLVT